MRTGGGGVGAAVGLGAADDAKGEAGGDGEGEGDDVAAGAEPHAGIDDGAGDGEDGKRADAAGVVEGGGGAGEVAAEAGGETEFVHGVKRRRPGACTVALPLMTVGSNQKGSGASRRRDSTVWLPRWRPAAQARPLAGKGAEGRGCGRRRG